MPSATTIAADSSTAPESEPQRLTGRSRLVLAVLLVAQFMLAVDFSILNVALPAIGDGLGFSLADLQWVATAFALSAAGFTLFFGRIGDLIGRKRIFIGSLGLLGVASLAGGLATSPEVLLAARVAQGLATAAATPAGLSLLTTSFAEGPLRQKALGINGALMAGFTTGAILGGVLTDLLSWRWAFFVNVPVALAVVLVAPVVIQESRPARRPGLDLPGALTVTLGLLGLVYGMTQAGEYGWTHPHALTGLAAGVLLLTGFVLIERRVPAPLVPLGTLRRPTVAWGNLLGLLAFVTETSLVYLLTLYLQKTLGFSPLAAGVTFGVLGAGTVVGGLLAPRVLSRTSTVTVLVGGGIVQAVFTATLLLLGTTTGASLALLLPATFFGGVGNMLVIVGFMVTATSGLPDAEQGLATGLASMSQQVGITLGTPVMSAVVTAGSAGAATASAVHRGVLTAIAVNAGLVLVGVLVAALFLRRRTGTA
ncbi:MFS transporter [Streptomyces sp. enrichment culture]|uniref:MFS transporter n=1 Tax=Streptomyces sp. enrichment culture TaxID=1795815 RepID=UPI003F57F548